MEKDSAEIKLLKLKLKLNEEINYLQSSLIRAFNVRAVNMLDIVQKGRKDKSGDEAIIIELPKEEGTKFYNFFSIAKENDLVNSHNSDKYDIERANQIQMKQEILKEL